MTFTPSEEEELYVLVGQAFELEGSPYDADALQAIVDWHDRRRLARLERTQEKRARLVRLLCETDPDRLPACGELSQRNDNLGREAA